LYGTVLVTSAPCSFFTAGIKQQASKAAESFFSAHVLHMFWKKRCVLAAVNACNLATLAVEFMVFTGVRLANACTWQGHTPVPTGPGFVVLTAGYSCTGCRAQDQSCTVAMAGQVLLHGPLSRDTDWQSLHFQLAAVELYSGPWLAIVLATTWCLQAQILARPATY
jgi:hypothetical protein